MDATVEGLGGVVLEALRATGYMSSTIGQYEKTIRYLRDYVAGRGGGVCTPGLGAQFAAMTTSPRTGRFSTQRRFDRRRLVTLFDGYLVTGRVDLAMRTRGGGGPARSRTRSWRWTRRGGPTCSSGSRAGYPRRLWPGRPRLPGLP